MKKAYTKKVSNYTKIQFTAKKARVERTEHAANTNERASSENSIPETSTSETLHPISSFQEVTDSGLNDKSPVQDSICQTSSDLSNNTPRKTKQRKCIHSQRQKIHRLQAAVKKKKPTRGGKKEQTLQEALSKLPENLAHFVQMQLELHSRKKKGRRYSPQMKSTAVSLYRASGKAYRVLSKLFILPTK